ncbi:hypothetical protein AFFFEF_00331 [Methylorubrum extorquens]
MAQMLCTMSCRHRFKGMVHGERDANTLTFKGCEHDDGEFLAIITSGLASQIGNGESPSPSRASLALSGRKGGEAAIYRVYPADPHPTSG